MNTSLLTISASGNANAATFTVSLEAAAMRVFAGAFVILGFILPVK
jgi:hypothetical protein